MENLSFLHSSWIIPSSIAAILSFVVFIWKESTYFPRRKFWLHSIIVFFAIASLMLILLKPAITIPSESKKTVLLSKDYAPQQLDSLKKKHKRLSVQLYKPNSPIFKETNSDSVFILGQGIEPYDFWQLKDNNVSYLGKEKLSGIISFEYDAENMVGEELIGNGRYKRPTKGKKLFLEGPGNVILDSVSLNTGEEQGFSLQTRLKVKGRFLYTLIEKDEKGNILSKNPIPVTVGESTVLKVLIVNGFPTFETKYLKNYLAEMGHQVMLRSQLTKGKYKYEYLNMSKKPLTKLDEKSLKPFDLLIIDAVSLKNMSKVSRKNLESAIRKHGLGVLVQSDVNYFRFSVNPGAFNFIADNQNKVKLEAVSTKSLPKYLFYFKDDFGFQNIHVTDTNKIISGFKYVGTGRVGATTLLNTYELLLAGNTNSYQKIWSDIISNISNKQLPKTDWEYPGLLADKDQPFQFGLRTIVSLPTIINDLDYQIPIKEDFDISSFWKGTTYPQQNGWNTLKVQQDSTSVLSYFVMDSTHWQSRRKYDLITQNRRNFSRGQQNTKSTFYKEPINPLPFFVFFIICIGYLWLAPKIENE